MAQYVVDLTKTAMAQYPAMHVIRDDAKNGKVVALCPIVGGSEPVCEGQFSYAPLVVRAVNCHEELVAALREAREATKLLEGLTACRSDDDYVWALQAKIDAALSKASAS